MPYVLGVDIGRTRGAAAVCGRDGVPRVAETGVLPVLALAGGEMAVGAAAVRAPAEWVASDLVEQVGDDVPVLLGGVPYTPQDLLAALVATLADRATAAEGEPPERIAVTHPPEWGTYRRGLLREALRTAGYDGAVLLPTVSAAAEADHAREPVSPGETVAVLLLGGRHVEYALLRRGPGAFEPVAHAVPPDPLAGAALDDLVGAAGTAVKEWLTTAPDVRVGDSLVTRAMFEELARPVLARAIDGFRAFAAQHAPARAVVAGGTAAVPLVSTLVADLPFPVSLLPDPATGPARGAALAARPGALLQAPGASDPALRPLVVEQAIDDTVVSSPGFPPVRAVDLDPPPRPPVDITPLVPPARRFGRRRAGAGR